MKKTLTCAAVFVCLASSAMAEVYLCKFNPQQTRGWAPPILYLDTDRGVVLTRRDSEISYSGTVPRYFWRENLRSSNGYFRVRFSLRVGEGIEAGTPVFSSLEVDVKGTQQESSNGTCELADG